MTRRVGVGVGSIAVVVIVLASGFVYLRGGSTPIPPDVAVKRFREQAAHAEGARARAPAKRDTNESRSPTARAAAKVAVTSSSTPRAKSRPSPPDGVYAYSTMGHDSVDILGGSTHTYPDRTTITVRHAGCGLIERWDVLKERWDERETCPTLTGDVFKRTTSYHEFFRHADLRNFTCSGYTYRAGDSPGASWSVRCVSDATTTVTQLHAVAWEYVTVGSTRLRTLHVHAHTTITGDQEGDSDRDVWGAAADGLVLRERARVDSDSMQPVFGKTHYHEQYEIRLVSLHPRR